MSYQHCYRCNGYSLFGACQSCRDEIEMGIALAPVPSDYERGVADERARVVERLLAVANALGEEDTGEDADASAYADNAAHALCEFARALAAEGKGAHPSAKCGGCNGTGADPMSDNVNWLPCKGCGGKGAR